MSELRIHVLFMEIFCRSPVFYRNSELFFPNSKSKIQIVDNQPQGVLYCVFVCTLEVAVIVNFIFFIYLTLFFCA